MRIPIIELADLSKRYGSFLAVDQLNLTIYKGEIFGLLGPNGAGKTTSILMMLGLAEPTTGTAFVCGENATRHPIAVKRKVGYLPDNVGFYDNLTGLENLTLIARLNGYKLEEADRKAKTLLAEVGLADHMHKKTAAYSRGMKQRLGLADVLIKQPEVVILDEPTLGIDPTGVAEFLALIRRLSQQQGLTVLLSSHHLQQVQQICDRVGIFVSGRLLVEGTVDTLATNLFQEEGYITTVNFKQLPPDMTTWERTLGELKCVQQVKRHGTSLEIRCTADDTPTIVRCLVHLGADITSVQRQTYTLDDIYTRYFENNLVVPHVHHTNQQ